MQEKVLYKKQGRLLCQSNRPLLYLGAYFDKNAQGVQIAFFRRVQHFEKRVHFLYHGGAKVCFLFENIL